MSTIDNYPTEARSLAAWAYEGEVVGEALFRSMALAEDDLLRRSHLLILASLERSTASRLEAVLARLQVTPADADELAARGRAAADAVGAVPWTDFLEAVGRGIAPAIERYMALRGLLERELHPTMDAVIAHEEALGVFVERSLSGADDPVEAARRLLLSP